jgi:hypothetical protein
MWLHGATQVRLVCVAAATSWHARIFLLRATATCWRVIAVLQAARPSRPGRSWRMSVVLQVRSSRQPVIKCAPAAPVARDKV